MFKFLILTLIILVVGYGILLGLIHLYKKMYVLEDEISDEQRKLTKELKQATDDFVEERNKASKDEGII